MVLLPCFMQGKVFFYFFSFKKTKTNNFWFFVRRHHTLLLRITWEIVGTDTKQPVFSRNSCSSFIVAVILLAELQFAYLFRSILEGHRVLSNVIVYHIFFHWTFFTPSHSTGICTALEIVSYPSPYLLTFE